MSNVSSIFVRFENMGKKDGWETISEVCLKPLHSAFGFFIYKITKENDGKINYEMAFKVNKFAICLFWTFISFTIASPLIAVGIGFHYFSKTFDNKYKELMNSAINKKNQTKQETSFVHSKIIFDLTKPLELLNENECLNLCERIRKNKELKKYLIDSIFRLQEKFKIESFNSLKKFIENFTFIFSKMSLDELVEWAPLILSSNNPKELYCVFGNLSNFTLTKIYDRLKLHPNGNELIKNFIQSSENIKHIFESNSQIVPYVDKDKESLNYLFQLSQFYPSAKQEFFKNISPDQCTILAKHLLEKEQKLSNQLKIIEQFASVLYHNSSKNYNYMMEILSMSNISPAKIIKQTFTVGYKNEKIFLTISAALLILKNGELNEADKLKKLSSIYRALQNENFSFEKSNRYLCDFGKTLAIHCEVDQIETIMKLYNYNPNDIPFMRLLFKKFVYTIFKKGEQWPEKLLEMCKHLWFLCEKNKSIDLLVAYQGINSEKTLKIILDSLDKNINRSILKNILTCLIKGASPFKIAKQIQTKFVHKRSLSESDKVKILEQRVALRKEIDKYLKDTNSNDVTNIIFQYHSFLDEKEILMGNRNLASSNPKLINQE